MAARARVAAPVPVRSPPPYRPASPPPERPGAGNIRGPGLPQLPAAHLGKRRQQPSHQDAVQYPAIGRADDVSGAALDRAQAREPAAAAAPAGDPRREIPDAVADERLREAVQLGDYDLAHLARRRRPVVFVEDLDDLHVVVEVEHPAIHRTFQPTGPNSAVTYSSSGRTPKARSARSRPRSLNGIAPLKTRAGRTSVSPAP